MPPVNRNQPKRAQSSDSEYSLMEFMQDFPDDATCLEWLWRTRYSDDGIHAECPRCEQVRVFKRYETKKRRQSWTCNGCGLHIHPTAGTIYHKSSTSLHLWFYAMYLATSTRCGISAKTLERELGVSYKTAWRMFNLIRNDLMQQDDDPLEGEVEMDETYVGGKRHYKPGRSTPRGRPGKDSHKTPVFGMVQRGGKIVAVVVEDVKSKTLMPHVLERVLPATTVFTDELKSYDPLHKHGYYHHRVQHAERVYVSGNVHVNTLEGFWSLVKNGIQGTYHNVSRKWLQGYLNEYAWRYNHRGDGRAMFLTLLLRAARP